MAASPDPFADENSENVFQVQYDRSWTSSPKLSDSYSRRAQSPAPTTYRLHIRGDTITATAEQLSGRRGSGGVGKNPSSVARRNARERRRIRNVNNAFDELRQHVPNGERNRKKISKVDTLQSAIEYIKALEELVRNRRSRAAQAKAENRDHDTAIEPNKCPLQSDEQRHASSNPSSPEQAASSEDVIFVGELTGQETPASSAKQSNHSTSSSTAKSSSKKTQRPTELTESMLKAFDVMLQKCAHERKLPSAEGKINSNDQSVGAARDNTPIGLSDPDDSSHDLATDSSAFEMQSQSSDSGISELLSDSVDLEQSSFDEPSRPDQLAVETDQNSPSLRRIPSTFNQDSPIFDQTSPDFGVTVSSSLLDNFSPFGGECPPGSFLNALGNSSDNSDRAFLATQSFADSFPAGLQWQEHDNVESIRDSEANTVNTPFARETVQMQGAGNTVGMSTWPGNLQSLDNAFDLQSADELDELDQINPTFDFLRSSVEHPFDDKQSFDNQAPTPTDCQLAMDHQAYDHTTSTPMLVYAEQPNSIASGAIW